MTTTVAYSYEPPGGYSLPPAGVVVRSFQMRTVTAAIVINEVLGEVTLPKGAKVVNTGYQASDLDADGAPAFTADIGDADNDDRFVAASTVGQAAGATTPANLVAGSMGYKYEATTAVQLTAKAAPATSATSGSIYFWVDWIA